MNTLNTTTHSSKEKGEFSFENAVVKSICYCKQWTKSKLSLSSECVKTKLCKPCTSFTSHLHSSCGMVWYRTLRVKLVLRQLYMLCHSMPCAKNMTSQEKTVFISYLPRIKVKLFCLTSKKNYPSVDRKQSQDQVL